VIAAARALKPDDGHSDDQPQVSAKPRVRVAAGREVSRGR